MGKVWALNLVQAMVMEMAVVVVAEMQTVVAVKVPEVVKEKVKVVANTEKAAVKAEVVEKAEVGLQGLTLVAPAEVQGAVMELEREGEIREVVAPAAEVAKGKAEVAAARTLKQRQQVCLCIFSVTYLIYIHSNFVFLKATVTEAEMDQGVVLVEAQAVGKVVEAEAETAVVVAAAETEKTDVLLRFVFTQKS